MRWLNFSSVRGTLRCWLQASGSLSARLAFTGDVFSVQVLSQGRQPLSADEAQGLGLRAMRVGYAREVLLCVDGKPMVFARSVTTFLDSVGPWRSVRGLGSRPLADVLFNRIGISRQPLEFKILHRQGMVQRKVVQHWQKATGISQKSRALPARRSVFTRHGAALLVMEVFAANTSDWYCPGGFSMKTPKRRSRS